MIERSKFNVVLELSGEQGVVFERSSYPLNRAANNFDLA